MDSQFNGRTKEGYNYPYIPEECVGAASPAWLGKKPHQHGDP
jgi:hypothetical protein